jgi:hypothetical protein
MAAYNDVSRLVDCMMSEPQNQTNEQAKKISSGRVTMYIRLTMGLLHEAVQVVNSLPASAIKDMEESLNIEGRTALASLRLEGLHFEKSVLKVMDRIRNKATFHYLPNEFADGIKELKRERGEEVESSFIYEDQQDGRGRIYYLLADHVRDASGFGLMSPKESSRIVEDVQTVMGLLFDFTHNALAAYLEKRQVGNELRPRHIP